jgi:hypothetical protein
VEWLNLEGIGDKKVICIYYICIVYVHKGTGIDKFSICLLKMIECANDRAIGYLSMPTKNLALRTSQRFESFANVDDVKSFQLEMKSLSLHYFFQKLF